LQQGAGDEAVLVAITSSDEYAGDPMHLQSDAQRIAFYYTSLAQ